MAMLSAAECGSRLASCSRVVRTYSTVDGSSWHKPMAPVGEAADDCHPDSHQHSPSRRLAAIPEADDACKNEGRSASRSGWASSAVGRGPPGPQPGGSAGPGSVRRVPATTMLGLAMWLALTRAATVVW